jgi:hypothetical protein
MIKNPNIYNLLRYVAIFGNLIYILWILYNGINEGFKNIGSVQSVALIGLIFLLILNIFLLLDMKKR